MAGAGFILTWSLADLACTGCPALSAQCWQISKQKTLLQWMSLLFPLNCHCATANKAQGLGCRVLH